MTGFKTGIHVLLECRRELIDGKRIAAVVHPASTYNAEWTTDQPLRQVPNVDLVALFGPEHGWFGTAGAGESIGHATHPKWNIPIYSLHGETKKPRREMFKGVDAVVYDLQDLGVRFYTYVSTLRYMLEAAGDAGVSVIVTDRPCPLAEVVDGPMLNPQFESFVSLVPTPTIYGMTSGEMARWLVHALKLDVDLHVIPMKDYCRSHAFPAKGTWVPPSPAIRSLDCARCYPLTVFTEALPDLDCGRGTQDSFRVLGAPKLEAQALCEALQGIETHGVAVEPCAFSPVCGQYEGRLLEGIRLSVVDMSSYKPMRASMMILRALQDTVDDALLWKSAKCRPDFFDQLVGTNTARVALQENRDLDDLFADWEEETRPFMKSRERAMLYPV